MAYIITNVIKDTLEMIFGVDKMRGNEDWEDMESIESEAKI